MIIFELKLDLNEIATSNDDRRSNTDCVVYVDNIEAQITLCADSVRARCNSNSFINRNRYIRVHSPVRGFKITDNQGLFSHLTRSQGVIYRDIVNHTCVWLH